MVTLTVLTLLFHGAGYSWLHSFLLGMGVMAADNLLEMVAIGLHRRRRRIINQRITVIPPWEVRSVEHLVSRERKLEAL